MLHQPGRRVCAGLVRSIAGQPDRHGKAFPIAGLAGGATERRNNEPIRAGPPRGQPTATASKQSNGTIS